MHEEYGGKYEEPNCDWFFSAKKKYVKTVVFEETDEQKLDKFDLSVVESYVRKKKLENINKI